MWALIVDGSINRFFKVPTAFKHPTTGNQYPRNWITLASDSEKAAIGIIEVTYSGSYGDSEYYTNSESSPVYDASAGTVVITKSKTAKNLTELKASKTSGIEISTNSSMSTTDWYVTRKSETSTAIPSNVTAYRTACRLVCNSVKTAIGSASDLDALIAIYTNADGIDSPISVDGSSTSVVSTSNNTITKSSHGLSNDEIITYSSGVDGSDNANDPITGLVDGNSYYVIGKTVNTFKLSHTNSHMGDAAVISLTGVGEGTAHTFTSQGIPSVGNSMPNPSNLAYGIE
tara:strand:- start:237 stop:1097 length:861 start_codon:yes stop_codon:yes gene_type:complete